MNQEEKKPEVNSEPPPPALRRRNPKEIAAACALAWAIPGAGHLYLGRRLAGTVFFAVVLITFSLGLFMGGKVYLIDRTQPLSYLATFSNLALGPLDLVGRESVYGRMVFRIPDDPKSQEAEELLQTVRDRIKLETYEYGTTYLLTASLMNILLILDVFDIGIGRKE